MNKGRPLGVSKHGRPTADRHRSSHRIHRRRCAPALIVFLAFPITFALPIPTSVPAQEANDDLFEAFRRTASLGFNEVLLHVFADEELLKMVDIKAESLLTRLDFDDDEVLDAAVWREGRTRVVATPAGNTPLPDDPRRDRTNVCYLADCGSDGIPDRAVEYTDTDGDGRIDRQVLYEITSGELSAAGVGVFVYLDLDGHNGFLHTTDYGYHSARDCWDSDFNGNICLVAGLRNEETGVWRSAYENPFCFFDDDTDGFTDQAVRFEGEDLLLQSIRWSFDADGDAPRGQTYDYDFSLTAVGPVRAPEAMADSVILRDGMPLRFASWRHARDLARWGLWRSVVLVWDEEDNNTDLRRDPMAAERWEGVIAESFRGFPQVGGPSCGRLNKRYEIDRDGSGRSRIYHSSIDQRIHLAGAEEGELIAEPMSVPPIRRVMITADRNHNGYFDHWRWGSEKDTAAMRSLDATDEEVRHVPLDTASLRGFWKAILSQTRDQVRGIVLDRANRDSRADSILQSWQWSSDSEADPIIRRVVESVEADRFLLEGVLWDMGGGMFSTESERPPHERMISIESTDSKEACLISVDRLPDQARSDLNDMTILELRGADERTVGQPEDRDGDGVVDYLFFPSSPSRDPILVINPSSAQSYRELVRMDPWYEDGFAFESDRIGFTFSRCTVGCILKRRHRLILRGAYDSLRKPNDWGAVEPLDGGGPGIGGLYLLGQGQWIAGFGSDCASVQRTITEGPLRTLVEILLHVDGQKIERLLCLSGEATYFEEEVRVRSNEAIILAFTIPSLETNGFMQELDGIWSYGSPAPGADAIGLAGCVASSKEFEYAIVSDHPAMKMAVEPGETVRLAWTGGGVIVGDSTASHWARRAEVELAVSRRGGPIYP